MLQDTMVSYTMEFLHLLSRPCPHTQNQVDREAFFSPFDLEEHQAQCPVNYLYFW